MVARMLHFSRTPLLNSSGLVSSVFCSDWKNRCGSSQVAGTTLPMAPPDAPGPYTHVGLWFESIGELFTMLLSLLVFFKTAARPSRSLVRVKSNNINFNNIGFSLEQIPTFTFSSKKKDAVFRTCT